MDQKTRQLMTLHKALHPRDDVDRQYVSRNEGRKGPTSIQDSVDASIQWPEGYIEKQRGGSEGGARGVMVAVVGNGHGDTSSHPGRD